MKGRFKFAAIAAASAIGAIALDMSPGRTLAQEPAVTPSASVQHLAQTPLEQEIQQFIAAWGDAWSPMEHAPQFSRDRLTPFYWQSLDFLAFDSTAAGQPTVIQGAEAHAETWELFVRGFQFWTFTPVMDSLIVYPQSDRAVGVALFADNYGIRPNGDELHLRVHATLLLEKQNEQWIIVHENLWGPVREAEATTAVQPNDEATIRNLTERWFAAWSPGAAEFTGEALRSLYAQGEGEILVFDDFGGSVVEITSFQDYLDTWVPVMADFATWTITPEDEIEVTVGERLAISSFTWIGTGRLNSGESVHMRQHGTLVWQRRGENWKIIHEHLTVGEPPNSVNLGDYGHDGTL